LLSECSCAGSSNCPGHLHRNAFFQQKRMLWSLLFFSACLLQTVVIILFQFLYRLHDFYINRMLRRTNDDNQLLSHELERKFRPFSSKCYVDYNFCCWFRPFLQSNNSRSVCSTILLPNSVLCDCLPRTYRETAVVLRVALWYMSNSCAARQCGSLYCVPSELLFSHLSGVLYVLHGFFLYCWWWYVRYCRFHVFDPSKVVYFLVGWFSFLHFHCFIQVSLRLVRM